MTKAKEILQSKESFNTEEEYRESRAVSYSKLKEINDDPNVLIVPKSVLKARYLDLGSVTDILLTEFKNFNEKICISKSVLPSDNIQKMVKIVAKEGNKHITEITEQDAVDLFKQINSQSRWLPATKKDNIIKEGLDYFDLLKKADGRIIVDSSLSQEAKLLAIKTKTHPWTKKYFQEKNVISQYKIKIQYEGISVKVMLDIVLIDDKNKTITPVDIKTGSLHPKHFMSNFYKYKYYYQGGLYKKVLTDFIELYIEELSNYKVLPFEFIFISTTNFLYPTIWDITDEKHTSILTGWTDIYGNPIKGIYELINDAKTYYKQAEKSPCDSLMPIDLQKTKGHISINP